MKLDDLSFPESARLDDGSFRDDVVGPFSSDEANDEHYYAACDVSGCLARVRGQYRGRGSRAEFVRQAEIIGWVVYEPPTRRACIVFYAFCPEHADQTRGAIGQRLLDAEGDS